MKALCWHGVNNVRIDNVPDPTIEDASDIIIKITTTAICGSDLHLLDGYARIWKRAMSSATNRWASLRRLARA